MLTLATMPSPLRKRYLRTPAPLRDKVDARILAIQTFASAPRSRWKATAAQLATRLNPRFGGGFSEKTLKNLWRAFRKHGPEVVLFGYGKQAEKPEEFIQELARRVEENKRVASVELDALRSDWLAGKDIPGYGTWQARWKQANPDEPLPETCPEWFFPEGFSDRNLRRYLPGSPALTLARDGYFAAHSKLPQKRNDYSGLRPLELVVFDDVRTDWLVSVPGVKKPCEFWLLVAMDAASRCIIDWVSLVAAPGEDGEREQLLEEHMQLLVGALLQKYGIPKNYQMTLKVENAKATLRAGARDALAVLAGGQVAVEYTRMVNRALPSGYNERHGTPWDVKGILERTFCSFHDHAARLPGQTGARYDLKPAELEAQIKEHAALMKEAEDLPANVVEQLRSSFLTQAEAIDAVAAVFSKLNNRHKHSLQGFDQVQVWRFPEDHGWRPLDELRRYPANEVRRAIFDTRMESPMERLEKLLREQPKPEDVPAEALLSFMARTIKKVRHPAPYTIAWTEAGVEFVFRGELDELASGKGGPFFVKLLPGDPHVAHLYLSADGRRIGALSRVLAPRIGDEEAQKRAVGEVQHYRSLIVKPMMERHAPARQANEARRETNAAIIRAAREGNDMLAAGEQARSEGRAHAQTQSRRLKQNNQAAAARARRSLQMQEQL